MMCAGRDGEALWRGASVNWRRSGRHSLRGESPVTGTECPDGAPGRWCGLQLVLADRRDSGARFGRRGARTHASGARTAPSAKIVSAQVRGATLLQVIAREPATETAPPHCRGALSIWWAQGEPRGRGRQRPQGGLGPDHQPRGRVGEPSRHVAQLPRGNPPLPGRLDSATDSGRRIKLQGPLGS